MELTRPNESNSAEMARATVAEVVPFRADLDLPPLIRAMVRRASRMTGSTSSDY